VRAINSADTTMNNQFVNIIDIDSVRRNSYTVQLLLLFLFFSCFCVGVLGAQESRKGEKKYQPHTNAVETISLDELEQLYLKNTSDTLLVVNFWATWCKPCVEELPLFEQITKDFATKKVKVVLVSLDFLKDKETKLIPFIKKRRLSSKVVLLSSKLNTTEIEQIHKEWSGAIPMTIIHRGSSSTHLFFEKQFSDDELKQVISKNI
jgi:thiol-disulfide isomerase/thioredoxin